MKLMKKIISGFILFTYNIININAIGTEYIWNSFREMQEEKELIINSYPEYREVFTNFENIFVKSLQNKMSGMTISQKEIFLKDILDNIEDKLLFNTYYSDSNTNYQNKFLFRLLYYLLLVIEFSLEELHNPQNLDNIDINKCKESVFYKLYKCNLCLEWETLSKWESVIIPDFLWRGRLKDWDFIYKEEQELPYFVSLNGSKWEIPWEEIWSYTEEFENSYKEQYDWYYIPNDTLLTILKPKSNSKYKLLDTNLKSWEEIWISVYTLYYHRFLEYDVSLEYEVWNICTLYRSK